MVHALQCEGHGAKTFVRDLAWCVDIVVHVRYWDRTRVYNEHYSLPYDEHAASENPS